MTKQPPFSLHFVDPFGLKNKGLGLLPIPEAGALGHSTGRFDKAAGGGLTVINRGWMAAAALLIAGCDGTAVDRAQERGSEVLGIQFWQNDQPVTLSSDLGKTSVYLGEGRFSIRVPNLSAYPAVQVCAAPDDEIFATIEVGRPLAAIRCFSPGTGVAVDPNLKESGYPLGLYGGQAHNYFHHSLTINRDDVRVINIGTIVDGMREGGQAFTQNLYLIVVLDKNNDKVVGADEFELFYIPARV